MPDEPTLGEVMRRLDETSRQLADLAGQMREDRNHAAATYVRQDVYVAQRQADHAVVADLQTDIASVRSEARHTEDKRSANVKWAIGIGLSLAALIVTVLALVLQGGAPA
ncbi:MAG TPA: hypothetical protein VFJ12_03685 [Segeticoccus sp.]|nr:hypothetical protein [Segeticoccus sp.]